MQTTGKETAPAKCARIGQASVAPVAMPREYPIQSIGLGRAQKHLVIDPTLAIRQIAVKLQYG